MQSESWHLAVYNTWKKTALGRLGVPSQVYFTEKYKHCNVQGSSWGEASSCESVHWARHISSDGIWHLDKRGRGVPPPHYLTPLTAESVTAMLFQTALHCTRNCTISALNVVNVNGGGVICEKWKSFVFYIYDIPPFTATWLCLSLQWIAFQPFRPSKAR